MSGLKSAWELSLEKSEKMLPDLKKRKKLTDSQKKRIAEIRRETQAKIADWDVTMQEKLKKLPDRTPPEMLESTAQELKTHFLEQKKALEEEMEKAIEQARN
jgi:hypothetical protein